MQKQGIKIFTQTRPNGPGNVITVNFETQPFTYRWPGHDKWEILDESTESLLCESVDEYMARPDSEDYPGCIEDKKNGLHRPYVLTHQ